MRNEFCRAMVDLAADESFVFLTGDLGFQALEPLQQALGDRFINAGVAEQNMVAVAAGLAASGMSPWVYSIAPFLYARPFEQIRNDVCLHSLPVRLVGNGGGYAYGVMGATHHALEDYGALLCLPALRAFVPAFNSDVSTIIAHLSADRSYPAYLRLGRDEAPPSLLAPDYAAWRRLVPGAGPAMVAVGPLAGSLAGALAELTPDQRPDLWLLSELPPTYIPADLLESILRSRDLIVVEEHAAHGGAGEMLAAQLLRLGAAPARFTHRSALGYPSGRYGSQRFHRQECGLDADSILALVKRLAASPPGSA